MATPSEIRDQLLSDLRATRTQLTSPDWLLMIRDGTTAQKRESADNLMKVHLAIMDLENQALATFRNDLVANEAAISQSTARMNTALNRLETNAKVLTAVSGFLNVIARVITLF